MPPWYSKTSLLFVALIHKLDAHAGVEERQLAQPFASMSIIKLDIDEIRRRWG